MAKVGFSSRLFYTWRWTFGFHEGGKFLDQPSNYKLLKIKCFWQHCAKC